MRPWVLLAGLNGFVAVAFAAYTAHGLAGQAYAQSLAERAWQFQILHALALLAAERLGRPGRLACLLFTVGILLFSGSLYVKALAGSLAVPLVTPAGGICFLAGWLALAAGAWSRER